MDQSAYTFKALEQKYDKFRAPCFEVIIGSKVLDSAEIPFSHMEVNLSADGSASDCNFVLEGQYDRATSKWIQNLNAIIKVGAKLTVKGGYLKKEEIFFGYVDDVIIEYSGGSAPKLTVTGLDGLGFLMSCQEPLYGGQKSPVELVKSILNKSVSAGFAKKVTVGTLTGFETPIVKERGDDHKLLKQLAQRYGASLFAVNGELIFDDVTDGGKPIIILSMGAGLSSFSKRVSLAHQVGEVEVWGRDLNQKFIKGSAKTVSSGGSGKSAVQLVPQLKDAVRREFSEYVRTEEECVKLAQKHLDGIAMGLVSGVGVCVGLPELIPGRFITIDGIDNESEGTYFLHKISHKFSAEGYYTTFEIKGAKI